MISCINHDYIQVVCRRVLWIGVQYYQRTKDNDHYSHRGKFRGTTILLGAMPSPNNWPTGDRFVHTIALKIHNARFYIYKFLESLSGPKSPEPCDPLPFGTHPLPPTP